MRQKQTKVVRKKKIARKLSKGFTKVQMLFLILGMIALGAAVFLFAKPNVLQTVNPFGGKIAITKPNPDMGRARKLTIDPEKDTIMQVQTREKVKISLIVPKGAITKKQTVEMIPYYYNSKSTDPSGGVIISPASVTFNHPVTLLFDLSESEFRTDAPKNQKEKMLRYSGASQVLTLDKEAKELIPVLVARELETSTQLRARILSGGGFVFTTQQGKQLAWAKHAFTKEKINSISLLEATNALLNNKQPLSSEMRTKAEGAVAKIISKKNPPASEIYAALVTKKLLQESKVSFIGTAYAIETSEGFFLAACKLDDLTVEQYVGYARAAQLMGYDSIGENCLVKAKNIVAKQAEKVLNNPEASLKETITALQDLQFMGIDEDSQLDEALMDKARKIAESEAKKVADDPNATNVEIALELQKLQAFGIEGRVTNTLTDRLTNYVESVENGTQSPEEPKTSPDEYGDGSTIDEEQILYDQAMSAVGIAMLKVAGFEDLDEASLKKKFEEMSSATTEMNEAVYALCLELGGDDCASKHAQIANDIDKALDESYQVADDIGEAQSQGYDEAQYDDFMYIEVTPEPEDQNNAVYEEEQPQEQYQETYNESYDTSVNEPNQEQQDAGSSYENSNEGPSANEE